MKAVYICLIGLFVLSCSEEVTTAHQTDSPGGELSSTGVPLESVESPQTQSEPGTKIISGIAYHVHALPALDYLTRKGESVDVGDMDDLSKETVFMLEYWDVKGKGSIFASPEMVLDKDKAIQYLVGDVQGDFTIRQGGKEFIPTGVFYEGQIGDERKLRVTFFARGLNPAKEYQVVYYDRLFGKGIIKLKKNSNEIIS
jgi:hypothetical protein